MSAVFNNSRISNTSVHIPCVFNVVSGKGAYRGSALDHPDPNGSEFFVTKTKGLTVLFGLGGAKTRDIKNTPKAGKVLASLDKADRLDLNNPPSNITVPFYSRRSTIQVLPDLDRGAGQSGDPQPQKRVLTTQKTVLVPLFFARSTTLQKQEPILRPGLDDAASPPSYADAIKQ